MTPQEFQAKWGASREQIAEICKVTPNTVNHWFSKSERNPKDWDLDKLAAIDYIFSQWLQIDQSISDRPSKLKEIYDELVKKKQ